MTEKLTVENKLSFVLEITLILESTQGLSEEELEQILNV